MRSTHTYAELALSPDAYEEIASKLKEAGYDHAFMEEGVIDMNGIGVSNEDPDGFAMLYGSDILPSLVRITDELSVQLGAVVRRGFEMTGMTIRQWNKMDSRLRDAILAHAVEVMKAESHG